MEARRQIWIDVGRGICIALVVYGHSQGWFIETGLLHSNMFYEAVHYFRMPLFFFLSGVLFHKAEVKPFNHFMAYRISDLLYVFILWTVFRSISDAFFFGGGLTKIGESIGSAFIYPLPGLWFVYTLAVFNLIARFFKPISPIIVVACSAIIAATIAGTSYGEPEHSTSL